MSNDGIIEGIIFSLEDLNECDLILELIDEDGHKRQFEEKLKEIELYCKTILIQEGKIEEELLSNETFLNPFREEILLSGFLKSLKGQKIKDEAELRFRRTPAFGNAHIAGFISQKVVLAFCTLTHIYDVRRDLAGNPINHLNELIWNVFQMGQSFRFTDFDQYISGIRAHDSSRKGGSTGGTNKHAKQKPLIERIHKEISDLALEIYKNNTEILKDEIVIEIYEEWKSASNNPSSWAINLYNLRKKPYTVEYTANLIDMKALKEAVEKPGKKEF